MAFDTTYRYADVQSQTHDFSVTQRRSQQDPDTVQTASRYSIDISGLNDATFSSTN